MFKDIFVFAHYIFSINLMANWLLEHSTYPAYIIKLFFPSQGLEFDF